MKLLKWIKRMIKLIQGTASTPVDDVRRQEIPSRLAIEKGMYPDEAIVVGQICGGDGMLVEQVDEISYVYNEQTGQYDKVINKIARGNLVINRRHLKYSLAVNLHILPYILMPIAKEDVLAKYGSLVENAVLIINGIEYSYGEWFIFTSTTIEEEERYVIEWLGNDMFTLEEDDSIILRI